MQRLTFVLAAAVALLFSQAPQALAGAPAAPAGPPPISKAQIDTGMKEAPPLVQQAGIPCTLATAAYLGAAQQKDAAGKAFQSKVYETACQEGMGYILMTRAAPEKPQAFDCVMAKAQVKCTLPANANPEAALQKTLAPIGIECTINNARYFGTSAASGVNIYEIGCAQGVGYMLSTPAPGSSAKTSAMSCIKAETAKMDCQFTPAEARVAHVSQIAAAAPNAKDCQVSQARWVTGDPTKGSDYYELGCAGGKPGFMIEVSAADKLVRGLGCAQAQGIAGGCTFTDVNTAATAENATYTKLATAAGMPCTVTQYRALGVDPASKAEVVEIACSNRPASAIAYFPVDAGGKAKFYDCVRATTRGLSCKLSTLDKAYPGLTQALVSKGKTTCTVSGARAIGTAETSEFIETACSDGLPGWVIEFDANSDAVKNTIACTAAKQIGGGCTLPTNVASAAAPPARR